MTPAAQTITQTAAAAQPLAPAVVIARAHEPSIWGLTPRQLHDAFWASKGVQCVRRGRRQHLQRGADLYLLIEPHQLVLFNIAQMTERLTWHNAAVTRLRMIDEDGDRYSEHVLTNAEGLVQSIERRYRPAVRGSSRVMLTSSRRVASIWMAARNRREGWDRVRRSVPWARVDHWKCVGATFIEGDPKHERQLLDQLVERWARPDQVITGLEEIEPGVWQVEGEGVAGGGVRIGPLWLGCGVAAQPQPCMIGPAWMGDRAERALGDASAPRLRDIVDIELADLPEPADVPATGATYQTLKRAFDVAASAMALAVLTPVMLLIALRIWLEDGRPIFFGHVRQGRGGQLFKCWKFRTMLRDAENMVEQFDDRNLCDGPQVFIVDDPRVTRIGRFLRHTSLDELPQFWNVLLGEMSLVGPRPSPDDENQYCPAWRDLRLSVRPGITGLWQLKRTREKGEDFQEWIRYDIEYVQRASFWLDLIIMLKTAHWMFTRRSNGAAE